MEEITEAAFDELLTELKRSSVHLEARDAYGTEVELPHMAKWKRGEPDDFEWLQEWCTTLSSHVPTRRSVSGLCIPGNDRLLSVMSLPNVALGFVPRSVERIVVGQVSFWLFDDKLVSLETPTASIEITAPREVAMYGRMFEHLRQPAVYGNAARALVVRALDELTDSN